jgi:hypothetical protein
MVFATGLPLLRRKAANRYELPVYDFA